MTEDDNARITRLETEVRLLKVVVFGFVGMILAGFVTGLIRLVF